MDAATLDRYLNDSLLMEASDGLDEVVSQLERLYNLWTSASADDAVLEWLVGLIANLNWWSGRLLGGLSFVDIEQGLPDNDAAEPVL